MAGGNRLALDARACPARRLAGVLARRAASEHAGTGRVGEDGSGSRIAGYFRTEDRKRHHGLRDNRRADESGSGDAGGRKSGCGGDAGGECSVSVPPFAYLAAKYPDDVALIWLDAHPDICLPYDEYTGYHAMAVTALMGMGDEKLAQMLPGRIASSRILIAGLRSWDKGMQERQRELGIRGLSPQEVARDSSAILDWLKETGASKTLIHFDLDVLDPAEIIAGVGVEPGGMKMDEAVRVINDIAAATDLVGLTMVQPDQEGMT